MIFVVVVFTLFKYASALTLQDVTKTRNWERGTGEPPGGTPSSNGLYRTGTFSGFRFMEG